MGLIPNLLRGCYGGSSGLPVGVSINSSEGDTLDVSALDRLQARFSEGCLEIIVGVCLLSVLMESQWVLTEVTTSSYILTCSILRLLEKDGLFHLPELW